MTESSSGIGIYRASYLVGLNEIHSVTDDDIDYCSVNESEANHWVSLHENKQVLSNPTRVRKSKPKEHVKQRKSIETSQPHQHHHRLRLHPIDLKPVNFYLLSFPIPGAVNTIIAGG
ncbi:hypothetical protein L1987_16267 [Smallanthus sonchifolius]|uniref:Uncharacterized protein n=1 Tax=Smallanthus sonchifolius TaxID=185202 RepID=A0ACB9JA03_9ASTR|nr:hypothetical protein L1987_16267 [Smallanthus sonchifolius]